MKISFLILIFSLFFSKARAQVPSQLDVTCIGPANAPHSLIYLHGMDSASPSKLELQNRAILITLANSLNIRIALPRAFMACPTQADSFCWGWSFNQDEIQKVLPLILQSRTKCFSNTIGFGMIGFSNGGYLLTNWYRNALTPRTDSIPTFFITSGSDQGLVPPSIKSLATNPPLTMLIGNQDIYSQDPSNVFFNQMKTLGAKVNRIEFNGGHQLDLPSLKSTLSSYLSP